MILFQSQELCKHNLHYEKKQFYFRILEEYYMITIDSEEQNPVDTEERVELPNDSNLSIKDIKKLVEQNTKSKLYLGNDPSLKINKILTNIASFDRITEGGIPRRRFTMFYGNDSSGKSTLSALCAKAVQLQEGTVAYIDVESSYDPEWWQKLGVNLSELIYIKTDLAENLFDILRELCLQQVDLIILDSIASLIPGEEHEKKGDEQSVAVLARLVNRSLKKIIQDNQNSAIILINQLRSGIGGYAHEQVLPGGRGQRFDTSLRCEISKGDPIILDTSLKIKGKRFSESDGYYLKIYIDKSKVSTPFKSCEIPVYFDGHVDLSYVLFEEALNQNLIEVNKRTYIIENEKMVGRENAVEYLRTHPEIETVLKKKLGGKLYGSVSI